MPRDLLSERSVNGRGHEPEPGDEPQETMPEWTPDMERRLQAARVDAKLAGVAGLIYDATQKIEPLAQMISYLIARWVISGIGAGLCFFAGLHGDPWQRLAAAGAFFVGVKLIWWRSR